MISAQQDAHGKIHQSTEVVKTPFRKANGNITFRAVKRVVKVYDEQGHLQDEYNRDLKYANRIQYKYNKRGECIEQNEFNMIERAILRRYRFRYDRLGNRIEELSFNAQGDLVHHKVRRFNNKGVEIEQRLRRGESTERMLFKYNDEGELSEEYKYSNGKLCTHRTYLYDEQGQKKTETETGSDGTQTQRHFLYTYDAQGNILEERVVDSHGDTQYHYMFAYDAQGHVVQRRQYHGDGHFSAIQNSYDEQGHKVQSLWYNSESETCGLTVYEYDPQGLLLKETMEQGAMVEDKQEILLQEGTLLKQSHYIPSRMKTSYCCTYKYYDDKQLSHTTETHYAEDGSVHTVISRTYDPSGHLIRDQHNGTTTVYQYDAHGNWVKRQRMEGTVVEELIERTLTYYP